MSRTYTSLTVLAIYRATLALAPRALWQAAIDEAVGTGTYYAHINAR